jgi:hypothetical protein
MFKYNMAPTSEQEGNYLEIYFFVFMGLGGKSS